jgi:hypothetical protein
MPDGARVLAGEGADPASQLVVRHERQDWTQSLPESPGNSGTGFAYDALRSTIGVAARLTVEERKRRPIFRPWRPRERP